MAKTKEISMIPVSSTLLLHFAGVASKKDRQGPVADANGELVMNIDCSTFGTEEGGAETTTVQVPASGVPKGLEPWTLLRFTDLTVSFYDFLDDEKKRVVGRTWRATAIGPANKGPAAASASGTGSASGKATT